MIALEARGEHSFGTPSYVILVTKRVSRVDIARDNFSKVGSLEVAPHCRSAQGVGHGRIGEKRICAQRFGCLDFCRIWFF